MSDGGMDGHGRIDTFGNRLGAGAVVLLAGVSR